MMIQGKSKSKASRKLYGNGELFIVSAPSGAGKTTLCQRITAIVPFLKHSISYTTRAPRKGELNDIHYTFVSKRKFKTMISRGEFAEWAVVYGNLYGTSIKRLEEISKKGYDIILDIDTQGAIQMKRRFKNAVSIFILPPSIKVLKNRLKGRKSELTQEIKDRLEKAREEIINYKDYDYIIVNDELKKALRDMESIITAKRLRAEKVNQAWIEKLY